jgi:Nif-specific regulatory protein
MQAVFDQIAQVSGTAATVLILGESGTGKELVAGAIHHHSPRARKPFVKVNCAALPESLIESELFGHEKGAFTGATALRKGRFEMAEGGTLFLDEIGDLSPAIQVKLLRVIQEREFERVGASTPTRADVRLITATHKDLERLTEDGLFRKDLYYRLNVFPIYIPPLRERSADIPLLADHFAANYSRANGTAITRISTPAIDMLMAYHWPGNVRELENCIERAVILSDDGVIHSHHLPPTLQTAEASGTLFRGTLEGDLASVERERIIDALKSCRGFMSRAAAMLGVTERVMGLRVKKYGIDPRRFRTKM